MRFLLNHVRLNGLKKNLRMATGAGRIWLYADTGWGVEFF